jgi:hypothetical protein
MAADQDQPEAGQRTEQQRRQQRADADTAKAPDKHQQEQD